MKAAQDNTPKGSLLYMKEMYGDAGKVTLAKSPQLPVFLKKFDDTRKLPAATPTTGGEARREKTERNSLACPRRTDDLKTRLDKTPHTR